MPDGGDEAFRCRQKEKGEGAGELGKGERGRVNGLEFLGSLRLSTIKKHYFQHYLKPILTMFM